MVRPSMRKHIHVEAFDKVREALNMVHHVKRAGWDLRVPMVLWAYRTMCETLTTQAPLKLKNEENVVIPMKYEKPSPCIVALVNTMVCGA